MIDSTNEEAKRLFPKISGPTWIYAERQTAGRGRRGHSWYASPGNLKASLALQLHEPLEKVALRSFVAALAVRDAVSHFLTGADELALKWPNDVLLREKKVAGILLESMPAADQAFF